MPLILLGLVVMIGLLIVAVFHYFKGDSQDHISPMRKNRNAAKHRVRHAETSDDSGKLLYFPTGDVENEEKKRNGD